MRLASVNGLETPFQLLHPDAPDVELIPSALAQERIEKEPQVTGSSYLRKRDVWEYEREVGVKTGKLPALLKALAANLNKKLLTVLDFGCGDKKALYSLSRLRCIGDCTGVTVHDCDPLSPRSKKMSTIVQNAAFLAPYKKEDGTLERCDALFSVHGVIRYHPFNQYYDCDTMVQIFGLLHALNFLHEGGLLLYTPQLAYDCHLDQLQKIGILSSDNPYKEPFCDEQSNFPCGLFRLERRPTVDEIMRMLQEWCGQGSTKPYYNLQNTGFR